MPFSRQSSNGSVLPTVVPKAVDNTMSVDRYYRSANLLIRQAASYRGEHNDLQLYTMLLRLVSLIVETVPRHKDFNRKAPEYQQLYKDISRKHMPELEQLKMLLKLSLGEDQSSWLLESASHTPDTIQISTSNLPQLDWNSYGALPSPPGRATSEIRPAPSGSQATIDAGVDLMTRDFPATTSQSNGSSYGSLPTFQTNLRTASQATRDRHALLPAPSTTRRASNSGQSSNIGYPSFDSSPYQAIDYGFGQATESSADASQDLSRQMASLDVGRASPNGVASLMDAEAVPRPPPLLGPQEIEVQSVAGPVGVPGPNDTCCQPPPSPPPPPPSEQPGDVPKKQGIREVHVSMGLMEEFLAYAKSNTRRNVESCGILSGVLDTKQGLFNITTLIVPKQEGTSDTVQALAEEEIFEAQDSRGLYPMGWIHTHPSQTCFLSSIDVHTQCGYQTMLDEAVAIVMAPSDRSKKCGIFRLSTPGGLKLVQRCNLRGFHAHPTPDTGQQIYELCGHVFLNERIKHEVIDLR